MKIQVKPGWYITHRPGRALAYDVPYATRELAEAKRLEIDTGNNLHVVYSPEGQEPKGNINPPQAGAGMGWKWQGISMEGIGDAFEIFADCPPSFPKQIALAFDLEYAVMITALPDLYDALKELREWTTRGPCQLPMLNPCRCRECKERRADEALAKARGEKADTALPAQPDEPKGVL